MNCTPGGALLDRRAEDVLSHCVICYWQNTDISCTMHNSTLSTFVQVIRLLVGYTGALFAFYSLVPSVLNWSGAAILNLSLLSSNLWAALARSIFLGRRQSCTPGSYCPIL